MMRMPSAGYCLYKMGCRGPVTYNACGVMRWNNGVSFPIQSGHGCIGCSEANFWDNGPFYQHLASFPGFGIETTADKVGLVVGAGTVDRYCRCTPSRPISENANSSLRKSRAAEDTSDTKKGDE